MAFQDDSNTFPPLDSSVRLGETPVDLYIKQVEPHTKEGKNSWKLTVEILAPETLDVGGKTHMASGVSFITYVSLNKANFQYKFGLFNLLAACGYKRGWDSDSPYGVFDKEGNTVNVPFTGKVVRAVINTQASERKSYEELSEAEKAAGTKPKLVVVKDDKGQPVIQHQLRIVEWLGQSNITPPGSNF